MDVEIRHITEKEHQEYLQIVYTVFGMKPVKEYLKRRKHTMESDRCLAAYVDGKIVGANGVLSFTLSIPKGTVKAGGIIDVVVYPTHRRQGIMSKLMKRQLNEILNKNEPIAFLYSADSGTYGRFGFGLATFQESWEIQRTDTKFRKTLTDYNNAKNIEMVSAKEISNIMPKIYNETWYYRPGMIKRGKPRWDRLKLEMERQDIPGISSYALFKKNGNPEGYVNYRLDLNTTATNGNLMINEIISTTNEAHLNLLNFCLNIDGVKKITSKSRPLDDPITWILEEPRKLYRNVEDQLHLRILDVPNALISRKYNTDGQITMLIKDNIFESNNTKFILKTFGDIVTCEKTDLPHDITIDIRELGSLYLGGTNWLNLWKSKLIETNSFEKLQLADQMFYSTQSPWCADYF